MPAGVSRTPRGMRWKSSTLYSCSIDPTWLVTLGWLTLSLFAAPVKLRSRRSSMSSPGEPDWASVSLQTYRSLRSAIAPCTCAVKSPTIENELTRAAGRGSAVRRQEHDR